MPRKVKIILNPMADMGNAYKVANDLRPIIAEYGRADWSGTVYPTHATELAEQAGEQGYDMVIAMGGDGTIHEVINGLMKIPEEVRPILGDCPCWIGQRFCAFHRRSHELSPGPGPCLTWRTVKRGHRVDDRRERPPGIFR